MVDPDQIYAEARSLAAMLACQGMGESADRLTDAIEGGSTGSEIMMALHWHIQELLNEAVIEKKVRSKATELLSDLRMVLRD